MFLVSTATDRNLRRASTKQTGVDGGRVKREVRWRDRRLVCGRRGGRQMAPILARARRLSDTTVEVPMALGEQSQRRATAVGSWFLGGVCSVWALAAAAVAAPEQYLTKRQVLERFTTPAGDSAAESVRELIVAPRAAVRFRSLVGDTPRLVVGSTGFAQSAPVGDDVDLRAFDTPPKNQKSNGWCTAFATVAAMENLANQGGTPVSLSEEHLWSLYRQEVTTAALTAANANFIVTESVWPYGQRTRCGSMVIRTGSSMFRRTSGAAPACLRIRLPRGSGRGSMTSSASTSRPAAA